MLGCVRSISLHSKTTRLNVVRCTLTRPKETEDWRRTVIFYTYIKCGGKECKIIIDNDNCINYWVEYLQAYLFVLKHKYGIENKVADDFSRRVTLLSVMSVEVTRFERLKEEYKSCLEFEEIYLILKGENHRDINGYQLKDFQPTPHLAHLTTLISIGITA